MKIQRERWVIIRDGKDIFCGLARQFQFKPINDIGDTAIKTYLSKNKAISAFERSWGFSVSGCEAVKVIESIESEEST